MRRLALALMLGLLTNYAVVLLVGSLSASLAVALLMSIGGWILAIRAVRTPHALRLGVLRWSIVSVTTALFAVPILFMPLSEWDARSIWFFHGKMIFYNDQTMSAAAGWDEAFSSFSHVGYPKLAPILSAQFAAVAGYWNEFLPKATLLALFVPGFIAMLAYVRRPTLSALFLIVGGVLPLGRMLWNGYMDGYLALYTGLACLFVYRWLSDGDETDALVGIAATCMTLSLKNEGALVGLCLAVCVAGALLLRNRIPGLAASRLAPSSWVICAICVLGPMTWVILKLLWQVPSPAPARLTNLTLARERMNHAAEIAQAMMVKESTGNAVGILAFTMLFGWVLKKRIRVDAWCILVTAGLYSLAIFWVYLTTKYDLTWHLTTSAGRTVLSIKQLLLLAAYVVLTDLETVRTPDPAQA